MLFLVAWWLLDSRFGRSLRAVRDSELAAAASGVNRSTYKVAAFGVSAAFAGVAGALLAINVAYVSPDTFPIQLSLYLLVGAVVGFYGSIWGAVLGALLIQFLPDLVRQVPHIDDKQAGPTTFFFGLVLVVLMLLLPLLLRIAALFTNRRLPSGAMTRNLIASAVALAALVARRHRRRLHRRNARRLLDQITLGSSGPLTGEAAAAAGVLRGAEAYFKYVNSRGGVNGRKIDFKYLDDGYDPSRTVAERARADPAGQRLRALLGRRHERQPRDPRLRERRRGPAGVLRRGRDDVRPRLREVPVDDRLPAAVLGGGRALRAPHPRDERQEGEDRRPLPERRLRQGHARRVPQGARREGERRSCRPSATTRPTSDVQSQVAQLKASGANTFCVFAFGKFAIQSFVYASKLGWKPQIYVNDVASASSIMKLEPAGQQPRERSRSRGGRTRDAQVRERPGRQARREDHQEVRAGREPVRRLPHRRHGGGVLDRRRAEEGRQEPDSQGR